MLSFDGSVQHLYAKNMHGTLEALASTADKDLVEPVTEIIL